MKKFILVFALFSLSSLSAQIDFSSTRFGIIAGPNYSAVKNAHNSSGPRYSFFAGVLALIPIDQDEQFYLQPEILYVNSGEKGDKNYENEQKISHATYAANYLSIPINLKFYFSDAESEFFGFAGPRFDFLINQKVTNPSRDSYKINTYGKAAKFNFAAGLGVGYSFKRQFDIFAKYDAGINNAYPDLSNSPEEISTIDRTVLKTKSQQNISIGLSYIFQ